MMNRRNLRNIAATCLSLTTATAWGSGLAGDEVQGSLVLPLAPQAGNWFSLGANGSPISGLPTSAIVGPGIEFRYSPSSPGDGFIWSVTADLSGNQIQISERYADSNPGSTWVVQISSFTLTLSDLDWAGAPGISSMRVISPDPNISLLGFDAHSVQFHINDVVLYPSGPYSYSRSTVIALAAVPEPSTWVMLACGGIIVFVLRPRSHTA